MTTIYFHVPDMNHATGGIRAAYRMVDACNAAGLPAAIMHQRKGFRPSWFASNTTVVYAQHTRLRGDDVLVVSELDAPRLLQRAPGVTKVVLNQQHYWTFVSGDATYRQTDVALVIAVSEDGLRYLTYAFPDVDVRRLHVAVEPLTDADLNRTVTIRAEPHSVMQAINRQVAHYAQHIGQIVFLAKHFQSADWKSLSIPRKR